MKFALDLIFILVFLVCIFTGYKRGFVKSLTDLVSNLIAVIAARIISYQLAPSVFSTYFKDSVAETLRDKVAPLGGNITEQVNNTLDYIPSGFLSIAGVDGEKLAETVSSQIEEEGVSLVEALMNNIVSPIGTFILRIVIFVAAFAVCLVVMKLISLLLNKLSKLPVLKQANKAFGFVFGGIKGIVLVLVICAVLSILSGIINSDGFSTLISNSYVVSAFNSFIGTAAI